MASGIVEFGANLTDADTYVPYISVGTDEPIGVIEFTANVEFRKETDAKAFMDFLIKAISQVTNGKNS